MRKIKNCLFAALAATLLASLTFGLTADEKFLLNKKHGSTAAKIQLGDLLDGKGVRAIARVVYDSQATQRLSTITNSIVGNHLMGVKLPANAVVTDAYMQVLTQFADDGFGGAGTIGVTCATAEDLITAADQTGVAAGAFIAGVPVGTAATLLDVGTAECEISVDIATDGPASGKGIIFVEYLTTDAS